VNHSVQREEVIPFRYNLLNIFLEAEITGSREYAKIPTVGVSGWDYRPPQKENIYIETYEITTLLDNRLSLSAPLTICIEKEGDFFVVQSQLLEEFGYGYNLIEAIDDLRMTISELYWTLKSERNRLGTHLRGIRDILTTLIKEK
jgi:hypothetical protein